MLYSIEHPLGEWIHGNIAGFCRQINPCDAFHVYFRESSGDGEPVGSSFLLLFTDFNDPTIILPRPTVTGTYKAETLWQWPGKQKYELKLLPVSG